MLRPLRFASSFCLVVAGLALAGCTAAPPRPTFTDITFADRPPIKLDIREVEIVQAYRSPHAAPNVEHLFHVPPAAAAALWATDRLMAAGPMHRARYIVREASVIETSLKQSGGLTGAFTTEQSERYDARLVVDLNIVSEADGSEGTLTVKVERSRTVPENLTFAEREQVWHEITGTMMRELDAQLDESIKKVFYTYLLL